MLNLVTATTPTTNFNSTVHIKDEGLLPNNNLTDPLASTPNRLLEHDHDDMALFDPTDITLAGAEGDYLGSNILAADF